MALFYDKIPCFLLFEFLSQTLIIIYYYISHIFRYSHHEIRKPNDRFQKEFDIQQFKKGQTISKTYFYNHVNEKFDLE